MIRIFNSAYFHIDPQERFLDMDEVTVRSIRLNAFNEPILTFAHKDYPLGDLCATYNGSVWSCDMD